MSDHNANLTGIWHGIYTYPDHPHMPESHYVCVMIDSGGHLSGTIHESMNHYRRAATEERADLEGMCEANRVAFVKTYNGHGTQKHTVHYDGALNGERDEIERQWTVHEPRGTTSGRFLMIRKRTPAAAQSVEAFERA